MFGSKLTAYLPGGFQFSTPGTIVQIPHQVNKRSVISATSSQMFGRVGLTFMSGGPHSHRSVSSVRRCRIRLQLIDLLSRTAAKKCDAWFR